MNTLQAERRWCVWKYEQRDGKATKVPYMNDTTRAKSNDPQSWICFEKAQDLKDINEGISGVGFFLSARENDAGSLLCVIDIDAHHTAEGANQLADEVLQLFAGTYIERSPSGNGYHIICNVKTSEVPPDVYCGPEFYKKNSGPQYTSSGT